MINGHRFPPYNLLAAAGWALVAGLLFYASTRETVWVPRVLLLAGIVVCVSGSMGSVFERGSAWALLAILIVSCFAIFSYLAV